MSLDLDYCAKQRGDRPGEQAGTDNRGEEDQGRQAANRQSEYPVYGDGQRSNQLCWTAELLGATIGPGNVYVRHTRLP